ncbi:MAG: aminotransferase class IV [Oligoflexales bacterium]|nr:aminotransferase class IV [Oligoflexales bacterium]
MIHASWNGEKSDLETLMIPALDRAYLFGDAVYEVIKVCNHQAVVLDKHMQRLRNSLAALKISYDTEIVRKICLELMSESQVEHGMIYIQISRGSGDRVHVPVKPLSPNCLIFCKETPSDPYLELRKGGVKAYLHPEQRWRRCDIKTVNLLGNVLAMMEAKNAGFDEAIFVDENELITEAPHSSVFMVKDGKVFAAPLSAQILPSITRELVLGLCNKLSLPICLEHFSKTKLLASDEAFLAGTLSEVLPVTMVGGDLIASGKPGPLTLTLQQQFRLNYRN